MKKFNSNKAFFGKTNDDVLLELKNILIKIHRFNYTQEEILKNKKNNRN